MVRIFCIAGPTASGKSELAADVASRVGAEIVNADAFQIYEGFDVLSGKPDPSTLRSVPHHLIGIASINEEMSVAKYQSLARPIIEEINARGKLPIVTGGSGLYIKSLTHGLADLPAGDPQLREQLNQLGTDELRARLTDLDPEATERVDVKNRRRLIRAIEIATLTNRATSEQRTECSIGFQPMNSKSSAGSRCRRKRRVCFSQPRGALPANQSPGRSDVAKRGNRRGA